MLGAQWIPFEQVLTLVAVGGLKNPYMDPRHVSTFTRSYLGWRSRVALNLLQRKRYQQNGTFAERGQAAPDLTAAAPPARVAAT